MYQSKINDDNKIDKKNKRQTEVMNKDDILHVLLGFGTKLQTIMLH